jgi:hypothetical protein
MPQTLEKRLSSLQSQSQPGDRSLRGSAAPDEGFRRDDSCSNSCRNPFQPPSVRLWLRPEAVERQGLPSVVLAKHRLQSRQAQSIQPKGAR